MALHKDFPPSLYAILNLETRWFPAAEALRETSAGKLMPPLVYRLRRKVKEFRDSGYAGAGDTSKSLLNGWFKEPHLFSHDDGTMVEFQYFFAQREALETIPEVTFVQDGGGRSVENPVLFDALLSGRSHD